VNGWDVQPTLDWAIARSSVRVVRNRLIAIPGPDPASPATHLRGSTVQAGNLSWSAPQLAAADLAVAQPTTVFITRLARGP
jgi:hypothetical protein